MSAESNSGRASGVALLAADNGPQSAATPSGGSQTPATAPDPGPTIQIPPPGNCVYAVIGHPPELVIICKVSLTTKEEQTTVVPVVRVESPFVTQGQFVFGLAVAFIAGIILVLVVGRLSRR